MATHSQLYDDAYAGLSGLGSWHDGLGIWLSAFLRLRHLRRAGSRDAGTQQFAGGSTDLSEPAALRPDV